jgi:hypothetical protein
MQILKLGFLAVIATSTMAFGGVSEGQNQATASSTPIEVIHSREWTKSDTVELIRAKAVEYGVDVALMYDIVDCETGGDMGSTTIQSRHYLNGIREKSFGVVQINLPSWVGKVTYEQAIDPVFSIDFLADKIKHGKEYLWSCYALVR